MSPLVESAEEKVEPRQEESGGKQHGQGLGKFARHGACIARALEHTLVAGFDPRIAGSSPTRARKQPPVRAVIDFIAAAMEPWARRARSFTLPPAQAL